MSTDRLFSDEATATKIKIGRMLKHLSDNIRARRIALGLTQAELAERANLSVKYVGRLETAYKNGVVPSVAVMSRLCGALLVTPNDLLQTPAAPATRRRATKQMIRRDLSKRVLDLSDDDALLVYQLVTRVLKAAAPRVKSTPTKSNA